MINIENLAFRYQNAEKLFANLSLQIEPGSICGLLGPNGAGKTTLLKIISGLLFSQQGKCNVLGFKPNERRADFLENIYFLPEEFYVPEITIDEYIKLYAVLYKKFDYKFFASCANEFQLSRDKKLTQHSYGQKKKFLIAFALATNCSLIMFDEPTNGLDIPSKTQFRKLLAGAITDARTFIISTHQVRDVEHLIDPIVILHQGKIILNQSVAVINKCLDFSVQTQQPDETEVFYYEKSFNGYSFVAANKNTYESELDIEMLFKAVLANSEKINALIGGDQNAK